MYQNKNKTLIEVICFLVIGLCIALGVLRLAISKVDTKPYYEYNLHATAPDPCTLEAVVCDNEPKTVYAKVTQYTKVETCPNRQCHTANGEVPSKDKVAACPRSITLGTRVRIGTNEYICTDRTARRFDGRYDIYHGATEADYEEALAFGIQTLPITIYE